MTVHGIDIRRLAEASLEAALVLAAAVLPVAWRAIDGSLAVVLAGMAALLTAGIYALHAVTFDCFRVTWPRAERKFSYTQREE